MVAWFTWYARNILLLIHNRNHLSLYTHTVMRFVVSSKCPIVCSGTTLVQMRGRDAIFQRSVRYAKTKLNCLRLGFQQLVLVNENVAFLSVCLRRTTGLLRQLLKRIVSISLKDAEFKGERNRQRFRQA